ncbi:MAG: FAD-dependent oxidoreductase, partial [Candidatus Korobacteraceae bacterium]
MTAAGDNSRGRSVAVIGGGLAGLSAASALADAGYHVELFERR